MPNPYFTSAFTAVPGSRAQARAVDFDLEAVQAGFDAVYAAIQALGGGTTLIGSRSDVPASYAGAARKALRVNLAANGIEFVGWGTIPIVSITSSRSLLPTDFGCLLVCNSGSPITLTVDPNATTPIPPESTLVVAQWGAGRVTIAPGSGVALRSAGGLLTTRAQFSQITVIKTDTDELLIGGDTAA